MKNAAKNFLKYTGIVTLSQCINGKTIILSKKHNKGGGQLFNFLADCLIGDFTTANLNKPTKIMLLNKEVLTGDNCQYTKAANTGVISLLNVPEKIYSNNACIVKYSFIIPRAMLSSSFNGIGLYTSASAYADTASSFVAFCDVPIDNISISNSTVLVVDWELIISNS